MKFLFPIILLSVIYSCGNSENNSSNNETNLNSNDTISNSLESMNSNFLSVEKWDSLTGETKEYFIISYAGVEQELDAIAKVDSLKPTYPNAGYLWIPDFASLSGKEMFAVFLDQSPYLGSVMETYQNQKKNNKSTYVVRVNQVEERWEAYSPFDIRVDGIKQKMVLTYSTPEDEEAYAEEGGEDWGWFVYDVSSYFGEHHPEVIFSSVYYNDLLPEEIKSIEKELELGDDSGFGYILIDGNKKEFIGHDMPEYVISSACEFFGFDYKGNGYE